MILSMSQVSILQRTYYDYSIDERSRAEAVEFIGGHVARQLSEAIMPYSGKALVDPHDIVVLNFWSGPIATYRFVWSPRNWGILPPDGNLIELPAEIKILEVGSALLHKRGWDTEQRAWVMGP